MSLRAFSASLRKSLSAARLKSQRKVRSAAIETLEGRRMLDGMLDDANSTFPDSPFAEGSSFDFTLHFVKAGNEMYAQISWPGDYASDFIMYEDDTYIHASGTLDDDGQTITADASTDFWSMGWPYIGHWDLAESYNVAPTATLAVSGAPTQGASYGVSLVDPSDPSSADTSAGFHYSFATDPGNLAASYAAAGSGSSSNVTFTETGEQVVYGRIFDKDDGYTDYSQTVTVTPYTPSVFITAPTPTVTEGTSMTLSASVTDPYHGTFAYVWTVEKNSTPVATITTSSCPYVFTDDATYVFRLSVTNNDSATGQAAARTVTVTNVAPTAIFRKLNGATTTSGTDNITFTISSPLDPSSADTSAGFTYAFDMNDRDFDDTGESPGSSTSKTAHWTSESLNYVYARVYDKDGAYNEYRLRIYVNDLSNDYAGLEAGLDGVVITGAEVADAWVLNGGSFVYDPPRWNRSPGDNNCYSYAVNSVANVFAQPGHYGGVYDDLILHDLDGSSIETIVNLRAAVQADSNANQGIGESQPIIFIDPDEYTSEEYSDTVEWAMETANYNEYYIVAMYLDPWLVTEDDEFGVRDYHFYRHDADGKWSHKDSNSPASNLDFNNAVICDPETADRSNGTYDYSILVGYFAVHASATDPIVVSA